MIFRMSTSIMPSGVRMPCWRDSTESPLVGQQVHYVMQTAVAPEEHIQSPLRMDDSA